MSLRRAVLALLVVTAPAWCLAAPPEALAAQCAERLTQYEGYTLRNVTLKSPFGFLRTLARLQDPLQAALPPPGSRLEATTITRTVDALQSSLGSTSSASGGVSAVAAYADNCDDTARELDLAFYVFTSDISAPASFSWEAAQARSEDPATAAGVGPAGPRFTFAPTASYNEGDRMTGGAQAAFLHPSGFRLAGEGAASSRYTNVALAASGSHDVERPSLWRLAYGGGYRYQRQPTDGGDDLDQRSGFAWLTAATRPLPRLEAAARAAVQLEGGTQRAGLSSPGFASDTDYTAARLLAGLTGGTGPHDYSLNLGYQLGATAVDPAWHKVVADAVYSVRLVPSAAFFDHRSIDLEVRAGGGWLGPLGGGRAPQNERFLGGARPRRFSEVPDWDVRSTPFLRGYPNNGLRAIPGGDASGREHFASLNLTVALTTWRWPLLPREVYTNVGFLEAIEAQKASARASLRSYHESKDPAIAEAGRLAADIEPVLTGLQEEVDALTDEALAEARDLCLETLDDALVTLGAARRRNVFGPLLRRSQGGLPPVIEACQEDLNATLGNPRIRSGTDRLQELARAIDTVFTTRVDAGAVDQRTEADFAIVDRALSALIKEINLVSLDPVVVLDTAYVGPSPSTFVRYSVGGGLRVTVGSVAAFTLGYAHNPHRAAGEPHGAVFFEMKVFDLFR